MKTYPILRLAIFMAAGIFFAGLFPDCFSSQTLHWLLWGLLIVLALVGIKSSYKGRWMFGLGVSSIMFLMGWMLSYHERQALKVDWASERQAYRVTVLDVPVEKPRSILCRVRVDKQVVLLYLPKDSLASSVTLGDELLVYTQIQKPKNQGNPYEFDYETYLYHQEISGTAYAYSGHWMKSERTSTLTLKQRALVIRERMMEQFRIWGVNQEQLPVISALTLGCKRELEEEVRDIYADAGISHVLALSGMHIGIVWLLLDFLLRPLVLARGGRWVKSFLSVSLLWLFAFVVGLEASVVRAVVMCMLMELARLSGRRSLSMNTLAIAALAMLIYRPFYLYDVGFQLSFVAVASIILFYPLIWRAFSIRNCFYRSLVGILAVSIAAQLGTAPLVMYYFSNCSVYFLLTNLVAALIVPFIIYGTVAMALLSFCHPLCEWVVWMLNLSAEWLTDVAREVSNLPGATFSMGPISSLEICLFYGLLGIAFLYGQRAKRGLLIKGLGVCVCLLAAHLWSAFPRTKGAEIVFYNIRNCPVVHLIEANGTSFLASEARDSVVDVLKKVARPFWEKEKVKFPTMVHEDNEEFKGSFRENIIAWHGKKIGILSDNRWEDKVAEQFMSVDYLYLSKGFERRVGDLQKLFQIKKVIFDASLSRGRVERMKDECRMLGLEFVDLAMEGSLRIFL
ncbi:MAG: ComEC/Rec2 family competence protein [Bacteroides sp.]|nr:ComEC/Rec2 family competence protein [Bacteroides sp.]